MARPKGTPKTGGRKAGTPNKATLDTKQWIAAIIDNNRERFEKDLDSLEPKERIVIIEKLMSYVTPKMQSVSVEAQIQAEYESLSKLLKEAPEEAIDKIAEKVIKMKEVNE
ncbi:hypothetical protein [Bacteroides sp. 51]|uniref:hypothetical protein n=1 Tax=Bacteroides sp. 51 TaxID=2302938 RepID=UPI0013D34ADC|nr:hypothetical protein [Bacteroides sp. 51]NDV82266.1 hypothetical protein [Bacteroides sp. 51]